MRNSYKQKIKRKLQEQIAQIPCGYNIVMIDKVSSLEKQLPSIEDIQKRIK